ncbi:hypothetical protein [Paracidovorax avenae]|uniref:hypothetical protein n=1 Tax=Paracidovorax avenae TaxID=80867 RepID=UPI001260138D|nr:hypothetical protein [Paracidovorax avenae]
MTHRDGSRIHKNVVGAFARGAALQPAIPGQPRPWDHTRMDVDVMATSTDGAVRRYPPMSDARRDWMPDGTICDIPAAHVKQRIGGIELTPDKKEAAFMVDGHPVSPLKLGKFQGHPLPDGKLLVLDFFKDLDHSEGKASLTAILLPRPEARSRPLQAFSA